MPALPSLEITRVGVGATVQDRGRRGHMHEGVPPGGAWVPELLDAANRALRNPPDSPAIELPLGSLLVRANEAITLSIDGTLHALHAGEELEIPATEEAVRYVAVPGGLDVPRLLDGAGTLLSAGFGGHEGRILRRGDVLFARAAQPSAPCAIAPPEVDRTAPIRVVPGPDAFAPECLAALVSQQFVVSRALDRTGTRLEGRLPVAAADRKGSRPMVRGAIQVTYDGTPIVLGPDHPTTGGYPVIAVVVTADLGALARRRPGSAVRFVAFEG